MDWNYTVVTAPKDGTKILFNDKNRGAVVGYWGSQGWTSDGTDKLDPDCWCEIHYPNQQQLDRVSCYHAIAEQNALASLYGADH